MVKQQETPATGEPWALRAVRPRPPERLADLDRSQWSPSEGLPVNEYVERMPRQRWLHESMGRVLFFPRTGLVGVPYRMHAHGAAVVVVRADRSGTYRPGGYDLDIGEREIETAWEVAL